MSRLRTALFINAHSRRARRLSDKVISDFSKDHKHLEVVEVIVVKNLKTLEYHLEILRAIKNLDCVIIGSGDGTIISVLNALKDRHVTYGFLPLGTSNTFVRSLHLPLHYPAARKMILKGVTQEVSLGSVNGVVFANIAGIGVPVEVTATTTNKLKKIFGPVAYVVKGLKALSGHKAFYCQIVNDDINEGFYTHYLLFANGEYHGNLSLGKKVSVFNDKLMLIAVGVSESRWQHVAAAFSVIFRRHEKDKRVKMIPFERALITTQPKRGIEADGEIISETPATVEIKKNAIRVFADPKRA